MKKVGGIIDKIKSGEDVKFRHQNPYLEKSLTLENYLLTEKNLQNNLKNISYLFESNNPIVLEIGCYMGKTLLEMSELNPHLNFIGLDITYKRVVKSAEKLSRKNSTNAKIIICEGHYFLNHFIPDSSLHGICIFFPDPWPKDRHAKNRLLKLEFIKLIHQKLKSGGFFWFKTVSESYFLQTEKFVFESNFSLQNNENLQKKFPNDFTEASYETNFQNLFHKKQIPFFERIYLK